jgi:hypothetical protein
MWSVLVVVAAVEAEHVLEMTAPDDEDPVKAGPDSSCKRRTQSAWSRAR